MPSKSLKATTAILAALSLMQPVPALTQSQTGAGESGAPTGLGIQIDGEGIRSSEEICAEAMIADSQVCELHILALQALAEAQGAAEAATLAEAEAEAAARVAAESGDADKVAAEAKAAEMARTAAEAAELASEAADTAARAVAEAEAAAQAAAEAETAAQAAAEAETAAQAATDAEAAAQAAAEAETAAQAATEAEAAAQAATEAEAAAQAAAEAEAAAQAATEAEAAAQAATEAEAAAQAATDAEEAVAAETPAPSPPTLVAEDCPAEIVSSDGTIRCVEALTPESIAAMGAETDVNDDTQVEVTTETVTESTSRASSEEFSEQGQADTGDGEVQADLNASAPAVAKSDTGLSDLEKAGLLALGAVVVGAILSNGQRVETNSGDRVIVVDDAGSYRVLKDDDALLRQPGSEVRSERFSDGSVRTTVTRDDGTRIVTIRDSSGRALRRVRIDPDGREYLLIDDTRTFEPVIVEDLPTPVYDDFDYRAASDRESLRQALLAADRRDIGRSFSLRQIREYAEVRELAPEINLAAVTFATNSAALQPSQADQLAQMGQLLSDLIADDPTELFLIEGHTDAVGDAGYNLLLSDRRAESLALAFSEYFGVPAENMVVQGYGESFLRVATQDAERQNRRVAVRRITALVR